MYENKLALFSFFLSFSKLVPIRFIKKKKKKKKTFMRYVSSIYIDNR